MSRLKRAEKILEAAEKWKNECLLGGGSVFTDKQLWTLKNFKELEKYFVVDPGQDIYAFRGLQDLQNLLKPTSTETKCLFAELLWVYYLIINPGSILPQAKRDGIKQIWNWSKTKFPDNHWAVGDVLENGLVKFGKPYYRCLINKRKKTELSFFIPTMISYLSLSKNERESLLDDHSNFWRFAEWLESQIKSQGLRDSRPFRHALTFLLFPDLFEPILVTDVKTKIINAYHYKWGETPIEAYHNWGQPRNRDLIAIDKTLLKVRERLEGEDPLFNKDATFYDSLFKEFWEPSDSSQREGSLRQEGFARSILTNRYERSPENRRLAIEKYGVRCQGCQKEMAEVYGEIAKDFIHIHHTKPLAMAGDESYIPNIDDLVPLCPNCHAVVHLEKPPISIDRLKELIRSAPEGMGK